MSQYFNKPRSSSILKKPIVWGIIASTAMLSIYFSILTIANSFSHALQQFADLWYWMTPLVIGFGIQATLYAHIRISLKLRAERTAATSSVAAAGGMSTTSMIACCAHHITDVLPILGISAAAIFLVKFQTLFIVIGILSNLIGINLMLKIIQTHQLHETEKGIFSVLMKINMKKALYFTIGFAVIVFLITLFISL